jgi:hypothetical protein
VDFVELSLKRNRGWPWPECSFGLAPMFGDDGWCRSCGIPTREQSGSLVLQAKGMSKAEGAWVPYWRYDAICLSEELASVVADRFVVELRGVEWRGRGTPPPASQVVVASGNEPWFDETALREVLVTEHGTAGAECGECGVWRWMPLASERLPTPTIVASGSDVVASPEWFGDGFKSFRQIAVSASLGELIGSSSPRDFLVRSWA